MTSECFNPECGKQIIGAGVCLQCANGNYKPSRDGVQTGIIDTRVDLI